MRKLDISKQINRQAGIPEKEAAALLDWILDLLNSTLQQGEPISIPTFGKFTVRSKASRPGRNPRTGEDHDPRPPSRDLLCQPRSQE